MVKNKQSNLITGAKMLYIGVINNRRGVEDTRLEAKNTKNPRPRQRQPFREQTLSRPRIGILETKDTNESGVLQKKVFKKIFSGDLQKKRSRKKCFSRPTKF